MQQKLRIIHTSRCVMSFLGNSNGCKQFVMRPNDSPGTKVDIHQAAVKPIHK